MKKMFYFAIKSIPLLIPLQKNDVKLILVLFTYYIEFYFSSFVVLDVRGWGLLQSSYNFILVTSKKTKA